MRQPQSVFPPVVATIADVIALMLLHGDWAMYRKLDAELSGTGVSITFFQGVIEIMSPSSNRKH